MKENIVMLHISEKKFNDMCEVNPHLVSIDYVLVTPNLGKSPRRKAVDDDCLIVGLGRDALKPRDKPRKSPDLLCPLKHEYYKEAITRFSEDYPKLAKQHMTKDIDPVPIENDLQDLNRTEYLVKYCSRGKRMRFHVIVHMATL
ncbi:hypothetical protein RR48_02482 [Papilio machaon]|uniref:Uncharacterized protein n=1 Tax=Papilio machaon TaxID=76193 RepID=A0A0N0PBV9_PAPMA|nr:hypothetical protein RR48_02482 [Papilio machaon]